MAAAFVMAAPYLGEASKPLSNPSDGITLSIAATTGDRLPSGLSVNVDHWLYLDSGQELVIMTAADTASGSIKISAALNEGELALSARWSCFVGDYPEDSSKWDASLDEGTPLLGTRVETVDGTSRRIEPSVTSEVAAGKSFICGRHGTLFAVQPRGVRDVAPAGVDVFAGSQGSLAYSLYEADKFPPSWTPPPTYDPGTRSTSGTATLDANGVHSGTGSAPETNSAPYDAFTKLVIDNYRFTDTEAEASVERTAWIAAIPAGAGAGLILTSLVLAYAGWRSAAGKLRAKSRARFRPSAVRLKRMPPQR